MMAATEFTDDSSSTLGLDHKRNAGTMGRRRVISPDNELGAGALARWDRAERDVIAAGAAEKREIEVQKLLERKDADSGLSIFTRKQAEEIVDKEAAKTGKERRALQAEERHDKAIENLMDAHKKVQGHGSSRSRRRTGKKGTWVCADCHLEFCEHRPKKSQAPGRPNVGGRSTHVNAMTSAKVRLALEHSDVSAGEIIEGIVGASIENGHTPGQVLAFAQRMAPVLDKIHNGNEAEVVDAVRELLVQVNAEYPPDPDESPRRCRQVILQSDADSC